MKIKFDKIFKINFLKISRVSDNHKTIVRLKGGNNTNRGLSEAKPTETAANRLKGGTTKSIEKRNANILTNAEESELFFHFLTIATRISPFRKSAFALQKTISNGYSKLTIFI